MYLQCVSILINQDLLCSRFKISVTVMLQSPCPICSFVDRFSFVWSFIVYFMPSVLWHCWLGGRKGIWPVKTERWGAGMVICLEWGADLHMSQLMPLPLTVSCFSKIQIGFTFLVPAHLGSPRKKAVKQVCVWSFVCLLHRECVLHSYWELEKYFFVLQKVAVVPANLKPCLRMRRKICWYVSSRVFFRNIFSHLSYTGR